MRYTNGLPSTGLPTAKASKHGCYLYVIVLCCTSRGGSTVATTACRLRHTPHRSACSATGDFSFPVSNAERTFAMQNSSIDVCVSTVQVPMWGNSMT